MVCEMINWIMVNDQRYFDTNVHRYPIITSPVDGKHSQRMTAEQFKRRAHRLSMLLRPISNTASRHHQHNVITTIMLLRRRVRIVVVNDR